LKGKPAVQIAHELAWNRKVFVAVIRPVCPPEPREIQKNHERFLRQRNQSPACDVAVILTSAPLSIRCMLLCVI